MHSLRHTFAPWLVQGGVSLFQVGRLLGHTDSKTTELYAHLQPETMHDVMGRNNL
ncbi:MAG: tyrosine-type recombinase/integrase [Bacteroidia bacterium]|nr:tyrosine-type recombinase/integrase [Bacteroidia bacterium]